MLKKIEDMNYYELLEVSYQASAQEIHKAYERIRKIYDPNSIALYSLFSPEETERIRQRIEDAYRTLIYDENRRNYDRTLHDIPITPELSQPEVRYQPRPPAPPTVVPRAEERPPVLQRPSPAPPQPPVEAPVPASPPPVPEIPQPVPTDVTEFSGAVLKMLRELRGLSTRNVADATKLSARYIEAIEDDSYKKLPARPYLRGFLFSYARAIGYEPHRIVNDYLKRYDAAMKPANK